MGDRRSDSPEAAEATGRGADGCASGCRRFRFSQRFGHSATQPFLLVRPPSPITQQLTADNRKTITALLPPLALDVAERAALAVALSAELRSAVPDALVVLRGSLAEEMADHFSDIDLLWDVPDAAFPDCLARLPQFLSRVRPVASLRLDPDFQRSQKRRLVFIRFANVPLFWRVDLDVCARPVAKHPDYDRDNPAARGSEWSWTESGLMNAVAAIKASCRGRDEEAHLLLERAELRLGLSAPGEGVREHILLLVESIAVLDPTMIGLAEEIVHLVKHFCPQLSQFHDSGRE